MENLSDAGPDHGDLHRKIILQEITEVEQRIARLQKQQEEAETILRSLKEPDQANRRLRQIGILLKFHWE